MPEFIFLMHNDTSTPETEQMWEDYFARLGSSGQFLGGSAIGEGECVRLDGKIKGISAHITGFIRVKAPNLEEAKVLLRGNPILEAGGTVEIRSLPETD